MRAPSSTTAGTGDVSPFDAGTSTTELDPYASRAPYRKSMPCVCGGLVSADIECPGAGVREHQATARHAEWRRRLAL